MKKKTLIVVVIIVLIIGAGVWIYFSDFEWKTKMVEGTKSLFTQEEEGVPIEKDDFSLKLPTGWEEKTSAQGVTFTAQNPNEEITDEAAQRINFQSYFSVVYDVMGENTQEEYFEKAKESLKAVLSNPVFVSETSEIINGQKADLVEIEANQRGVDFKVLLALIQGKNDDVWVLSFNTPQDNWSGYQDMFYKVIKSFKLKE